MTPTEEAQRVAALRQYDILDTEPELAFDDLTLLASQICETPIAAITLIDSDRQWFKSRVGLSIPETSRAVSFCTHAIQQRGIFVVPDASKDERLRDNPQVTGDTHIRFYAGAPLITPEGYALGTLCVVDRVARTLTAEQLEALDALRRQVEAQLALRRTLKDLRAAYSSVQKLSAMMPFCSTCQFTMTIPADPAAIPTVTDGVSHVLQEKGWSEGDIMEVELALQEAVANAIRHGCHGDATKTLECSVSCEDSGEVVITVRDPGKGFDPEGVPNPLDPDNLLKPSGRGIFLINGLMDEVQFADGGRQVRMRKKKA
ncbi:MAG: ATP-binding protein [Vicinamibacterales bacterium]